MENRFRLPTFLGKYCPDAPIINHIYNIIFSHENWINSDGLAEKGITIYHVVDTSVNGQRTNSAAKAGLIKPSLLSLTINSSFCFQFKSICTYTIAEILILVKTLYHQEYYCCLCAISFLCSSIWSKPQRFHFLPEPQGQGSLRPILGLSAEGSGARGTTGIGWGAMSTWKIVYTTFLLISSRRRSKSVKPSFLNSCKGSRWP